MEEALTNPFPSEPEKLPKEPLASVSESPITSSVTQSPKPLEVDTKVFAALSYLSVLFVIPWVTKKDQVFVVFHIKRGMTIFFMEVIVWFILWLIESFLTILFSVLHVVWLIVWLYKLAWLLFAVVSLAGVYWAMTGKQKSLPWVELFAKNIKI